MKKSINWLLYSVLLLPLWSPGQDTVRLSRNEVVQSVAEQNLSLRILQEKYQEALGQKTQANAAFLPQVNVAHTATRTNNPVYAFGAKLNQGVFAASDFDVAALNSPSAINNFVTSFQVEQPILNTDALLKRKAAALKASSQKLQQQFAARAMNLQARQTYMQLQLLYKSVAVLEKARKTALENLKITRDFYEQGMLQEAAYLDVQVRVSELKGRLLKARSELENVSGQLALIMNRSGAKVIQPSDSLQVQVGSLSGNADLQGEDLKAYELATEARKKMMNAERLTFAPRLNAFGNLQLFDNDIFQGSSDNYLIGARLEVDLFQGGSQLGKIQEARAQYNQSKLEAEQYRKEKELSLYKARRAVEQARLRIETTRLAKKQAQSSLKMVRDRYEQGMEKTAALLRAESKYEEKQLQYYEAIFRFNTALAQVEFLTGDNPK